MPYVPSEKTDGKSQDRNIIDVAVETLAKAIVEVSIPYEYDGAFLGELNYAVTRLIQRIPQMFVDKKIFKSALRYWIYAGIAGVLTDIKDEYKWRVNRAYEMEQILKSGDCYDTPYFTKLIEVVDETGKLVGYTDLYLKNDGENYKLDKVPNKIIVKKVE